MLRTICCAPAGCSAKIKSKARSRSQKFRWGVVASSSSASAHSTGDRRGARFLSSSTQSLCREGKGKRQKGGGKPLLIKFGFPFLLPFTFVLLPSSEVCSFLSLQCRPRVSIFLFSNASNVAPRLPRAPESRHF